jgi:hypothetical protein
MPRPAGYYWVKSATDSRLQIVLIQGDGVVWLFGQDRGQYIAGEEPEIFKGQGLSARSDSRSSGAARKSAGLRFCESAALSDGIFAH